MDTGAHERWRQKRWAWGGRSGDGQGILASLPPQLNRNFEIHVKRIGGGNGRKTTPNYLKTEEKRREKKGEEEVLLTRANELCFVFNLN